MNFFTQTDDSMLSETARYGYIPALDGLRAMAVLIVLIAHMGFEHIVPGGFGVTVFFFISGFLITRLLMAESEKNGQINFKNFYLRRFIRLYPALLFMILSSLGLYALIGLGRPSLYELFAALFYFTNFFHVGINTTGAVHLGVMDWVHLWSLAVEEHFYLIFPLIIFICRNNWKKLAFILTMIIIAGPIWRAYIHFSTNLPSHEYNYMMTDARFDSLAWGCLLSVLLHLQAGTQAYKKLTGLIPSALAIMALLASFLIRDENFRYTIRFSLQGAALFVLIVNFYYLTALRFAIHICELRPIAWMGRISYALYLWHVPIFHIIKQYIQHPFITPILTVIITFIVATISYYWVETPFIAMRKKFGAHIVKRP